VRGHLNKLRGSGAASILARALCYPYEAPSRSYCYDGGGVEPFDPATRIGRTPVLAYGSNRSPERLWQKFGSQAIIPVENAVLVEHDAVFSAHISSYGAIPATIHSAPGTCVSLSVTWLDDAQLELMHESEIKDRNYRVAALSGSLVTLDCGGELAEVLVYISQLGFFVHDDGPVALSAIPAAGRRVPEMTGAQVLDEVHRRLAGHVAFDAFVMRLVQDVDYRHSCIALLSTDARRVRIQAKD